MKESGRYYLLMQCTPAEDGEPAYDERQLLLGPVLLREHPPLWRDMLERGSGCFRALFPPWSRPKRRWTESSLPSTAGSWTMSGRRSSCLNEPRLEKGDVFMSLMTVRDALDWLNAAAPFDTAEDFDNVGLLIGDERLPVQNVIFGLDATPALVREAVRLHAQLIVTHHPLLFHPLRRIHYADPIGQAVSEIVENRMSLIAAHTNWDKAEGGVSDSLASLLELKEIRRADDYLRIGRLPSPMSPEAFCAFAGEKLGLSPRLYGRGEDRSPGWPRRAEPMARRKPPPRWPVRRPS